MPFNKLWITCFFLWLVLPSQSQQIHQFRWNKRVVLLLNNTVDSVSFKKYQMSFSSMQHEFYERKMLIFYITPKKYKRIHANEGWQQTNTVYNQYKKATTSFEMVLIGLDGEVKYRSATQQAYQKLFAIIDGMPMRRRELRRKNE